MRILLMEDDLILQESIAEFLLSKSYTVDAFSNSDDAFDAIFSVNYDLLLLDVNVPGEWNGFDLKEELVRESKDIPTIFVTSMSSADAMLKGYETGCCDYIKKPFDLIELQLRVQQALKINCYQTQESSIDLGQGYRYKLEGSELLKDDTTVKLSKTERAILEIFMTQRGKVVSFETLYEQVWNNDVDSSNARVHVNNLRRKLPENLVENVYGVGYRLDC